MEANQGKRRGRPRKAVDAINQLSKVKMELHSVIQTGKVAENALKKAQQALQAGVKRFRG